MCPQRLEDSQTTSRAGQRVDCVLWMRHQTEDVARLVADARNIFERAVRIVAFRIAKDDLTARAQFQKFLGRGVVTAGGVLDRNGQRVGGVTCAGERSLVV